MNFTECEGAHARGAVCYLCSDKYPWWTELRQKRGLELYVSPPVVRPPRVRHPELALPREYRRCQFGDCVKTQTARGLCYLHYKQMRRSRAKLLANGVKESA